MGSHFVPYIESATTFSVEYTYNCGEVCTEAVFTMEDFGNVFHTNQRLAFVWLLMAEVSVNSSIEIVNVLW